MSKRDNAQDTGIAVNTQLNALNLSVNATQQQQIEHHKKHIQALWRHIERLENVVKVIPEGVQIKAGRSEILVLKNGGIILDGTRIALNVPNNGQLITSAGTMSDRKAPSC